MWRELLLRHISQHETKWTMKVLSRRRKIKEKKKEKKTELKEKNKIKISLKPVDFEMFLFIVSFLRWFNCLIGLGAEQVLTDWFRWNGLCWINGDDRKNKERKKQVKI